MKFDEQIAGAIVRALRMGAWKKTACQWAGIDYTTFKRWMRRGTKHPSKYPVLANFARDVEEAVHGCEIEAGKVAYNGALTDPKIALEWLKVRHRRRWNPKQDVTVRGDPARPLHVQTQVDLSKVSDEDLDALEAIHQRAAQRAAETAGAVAASDRDSGREGEA